MKLSSDVFFDGYVAAALFTSVDDNEVPLDNNYTAGDIDEATYHKMWSECHAFDLACGDKYFKDENLISPYDQPVYERAGMDFWFSRNGHGVGFEDHFKKPVGEMLALAARACGERTLYVGDDGKIYME